MEKESWTPTRDMARLRQLNTCLGHIKIQNQRTVGIRPRVMYECERSKVAFKVSYVAVYRLYLPLRQNGVIVY